VSGNSAAQVIERPGIDREPPDGIGRNPRNQQDAAHGAFTCDAHIRKEIEPQPVQFGAGNEPDIRLATCERRGALSRKVEPEFEKAALRPMLKAPNQGPGIQVANGGYAQFSSYESLARVKQPQRRREAIALAGSSTLKRSTL